MQTVFPPWLRRCNLHNLLLSRRLQRDGDECDRRIDILVSVKVEPKIAVRLMRDAFKEDVWFSRNFGSREKESLQMADVGWDLALLVRLHSLGNLETEKRGDFQK